MTGTTTNADRERDLLARLGLPPASSPEAIETAYRDIVGYLARAPRDLKPWARWEAEAAGRAYALLIDPAMPADPDALEDPVATAVPPGGPATPPARRDVPRRRVSRRDVTADAAGDADPPDVDALIASVTPGANPDVVWQPAPAGARGVAGAGPRVRLRHPLARRLVLGGVALGGLVAIAIIGYGAGAPAAAPVGGESAQPAATDAGLDETAVAALMTRIQANPNDTAALMALGDTFYAAGDFTTAAGWLQKVLDIEPDNVQALVAFGAASFNAGNDAAAKTSWEKAIELDPQNVEAHYDLGFLYYSAQPPDLEAVRREWQLVIDLAPGTQIAQTVKAHLDTLTGPAPSGAASPAPSGAASPAPSAGASPAPSAGASPAPSAAP